MSELPSVDSQFGVKPNLSFPNAQPPAGLVVEVLHEGDGPVVGEGDTIAAHYLGQVWDGQVFDTSFDRGQPLVFQAGVGQVIQGWDQGLVGQTVGSRILLSIPPSLGYGDYGVPQAGIQGGDTLVFVTDIVSIL